MSTVKESNAYAAMEEGIVVKPWKFPLNELGPNDVEIKVTHCGICHSDIHTINGDWETDQWPVVPGHEIIGHVTMKGDKVTRFQIGDRVGVGPEAWACGNCRNCHNKNEMYCPKRTLTYASKLPSGYVTKGGYSAWHRVDERFAFLIPKGLPSAEAAPLLCAGITVFSPLRLHKAGPGTRVAVVGIGGLGHLALMFANKLGAEVTAISTSPSKEKEAREFGAQKFLLLNDAATLKANRRSFDIILFTVSANVDMNSLLALLDTDGKLVVLGLPPEHFSVKPGEIIRRVSLTGSSVGSPNEMEDMLAFAAEHKVLPLIERIPFDKVNEGIQRVLDNKARFRIVLDIDPEYTPHKL